MDLKNGINWKLRINQTILGSKDTDFFYTFNNRYVAVLATTTNVYPRNVVGYLSQTINVALFGGKTIINERFVLINKIPKIIIFPEVDGGYQLRYRFSSPVGNCTLKIWENIGIETIIDRFTPIENRLTIIEQKLDDISSYGNG